MHSGFEMSKPIPDCVVLEFVYVVGGGAAVNFRPPDHTSSVHLCGY